MRVVEVPFPVSGVCSWNVGPSTREEVEAQFLGVGLSAGRDDGCSAGPTPSCARNSLVEHTDATAQMDNEALYDFRRRNLDAKRTVHQCEPLARADHFLSDGISSFRQVFCLPIRFILCYTSIISAVKAYHEQLCVTEGQHF